MTSDSVLNTKLSTFFSRGLCGLGAGITGAFVLGIIVFLGWGILGEVISQGANEYQLGAVQDTGGQHPLFLSMIILAGFLSILVSTLMYPFLLSVVEERFSRRLEMISQVFFGNIGVLILMLPIYIFIGSEPGSSHIIFVSILHAAAMALFTFLAIEGLHQQGKSPLVSVYAAITSLLLWVFVGGQFLDSSNGVVLFVALPLLLSAFGLGSAGVEMLAVWLSRSYGVEVSDTDG